MNRPAYTDYSQKLPPHPNPTAPTAWWRRDPDDITGITIHHTISHDPLATARYCTLGKGRPSIQYHWWVNADGEIFLCAPVDWGMWHDHCGHRNHHISVGLAGALHIHQPPPIQLHAAGALVAWLMDLCEIPLLQVQGHNDRYPHTLCPGWDVAGWRDRFYHTLEEFL